MSLNLQTSRSNTGMSAAKMGTRNKTAGMSDQTSDEDLMKTPKKKQTQGLYPRMMNNDDIDIMERYMYIHMII